MSSVTGRFTGSPESAMEFDLARFREVKSADEFIDTLNQVCDITLTSDFWNVTLPNDLATSSPRSPSLFAFQAAQVILDARVLFSKTRVSDLLDPALHAHRSAVERHHLFPKSYLKTLGVTEIRDTNQIANFALVEWIDNSQISGRAPAEYLPDMTKRIAPAEIGRMYHWHALPNGWETMEYKVFLEARRDKMAQVIREGFEELSKSEASVLTPPFKIDLEKIVANGESAMVEFKSTLRTNLHTGDRDSRMEAAVLKTIAGFLNTNGGDLIIGMSDGGTSVGIERDGFGNEDKMSLHLVNLVNSRLGPHAMTCIHSHFEDHDGKRVLVVHCSKSPAAIFVKDGSIEKFYIRTGPSTTELSASQTQDYIGKRFGK